MSSWSRSAGYGRQAPLSDILIPTICQNSTGTGVQKLREHYNSILAAQNDTIFDAPLTSDYSSDDDGDSSKLIDIIDYPVASPTFAHHRGTGDGDQPCRSHALTRTRNGGPIEHWEDESASRDTKPRDRVEQILNRCLYLYSKRGLDRQSLISELQAEDAELKASQKEFRDQCYQVSKQNAETIYFGVPDHPGDVRAIGGIGIGAEQDSFISLDGVQKEFLELPPIAQSYDAVNKRATTKMEQLLAEREAHVEAQAEAAMAMLAQHEYEECLKLNQDWIINSLGSGDGSKSSSLLPGELTNMSRTRPPSRVPLTAAETFNKLLDSQFGGQ